MSPNRGGPGPVWSVVIPAHDEEAVLEERLGPLLRGLEPGEAEVVLVANGCSDGTAVVAAGLPNVRVLEIDEASKTAALDAGDATVTALPRVYLDADVRMDPGTMRALARTLDVDEPVIAAPQVVFDLDGAQWPVRAFYRVFTRLPYATAGLTGLGVYGVSAAGRGRFGQFPDVVADDLYVQRHFAPEERRTSPGTFEVVAPRTVRDLLAVRARVARGNGQLDQMADTAELREQPNDPRGTVRALAALVARNPALLLPALVYVAVSVVARRRAAAGGGRWERDESSRSAPATDRVDVDGVLFDALTETQVVERVVSALRAGRGGRIVTPNVDIHRQLRHPAHRHLLDGVELVVADGMPVLWAAALAGTPLPERVTGASLVWSLTRAAPSVPARVFVLGGTEGVAEEALRRFRAEVPGLDVAGSHSPPPGFEDRPEELDRIVSVLEEAAPDLVHIALGFPKQERLMADLVDRFPGTWFIGCGGAIDFAAGRTTRAPQWVQRSGLEWVHRLAHEPRRLARRYLVDGLPHAAAMMLRTAGRRTGRPS